MKSFFTKKNFMQKMIICIVMVLLVNFTLAPSYSQATIGDDLGNMFFNILLRCGDGIVWLVQKIIYGMDSSFVTIDRHGTKFWAGAAKVLGIVAAVAGIVALAAVTIVSYGSASGVTVPAAVGLVGAIAAGTSVTLAGGALIIGGAVSHHELKVIDNGGVPPLLYLPLIHISPETIFNNQIGLTDINFFNPSKIKETKIDGDKVYYIDVDEDNKYDEQVWDNASQTYVGDIVTTQSTAAALRDTITKWYYSIRNLALVGLLSVLIYVGIRIILSSSSTEKAKYKTMITDWVVAVCLVMVLHYIMVFAITLVERITYTIGSASSDIKIYAMADSATISKVKKSDLSNFIITDDSGQEVFIWPTNMLASARMESQFLTVYDTEEITDDEDSENIDENQTIMQKMAYTVIYLALIFFTLYFLFYYIRRAVYLAFLTLIAPLIALTYPIDKINDGSAQGFNIWLKEYMYNLLIQPFHLLLYTIFVSTAFEFAKSNSIYVCVILGFLMSAEKLLRKMFNFNKSETSSAFSGAAAGSMIASAISKAAGRVKSIGSGAKNLGKGLASGAKGGNGEGGGGSEGGPPVKGKDEPPGQFLDSINEGSDDDKFDFDDKDKELEKEKNDIDQLEADTIDRYGTTNPDELENASPADKARLQGISESIAARRAAFQKKLDEREAANKKKAEENKEKLEKAKKGRKSDNFKKGKKGKLLRPLRAAKRLAANNPQLVTDATMATLAPIRFTAGVLGGGVGLGLSGIGALALGDSVKDIGISAAMGAGGGYGLGAGGFNAVTSIGSMIGRTAVKENTYGKAIGTAYREQKLEDEHGKSAVEIDRIARSQQMSQYLDKNYEDADKKEKARIAKEIAALSYEAYEGDIKTSDIKTADKGRMLQAAENLEQQQVADMLKLEKRSREILSKKPSGKFSKEELRSIEDNVRENLIRSAKAEAKKSGKEIDEKALLKSAEKDASAFMENFKKLLK